MLRKRLSGLPPGTVQEEDHVASLLATYWQGFWVPALGGACEEAQAYGICTRIHRCKAEERAFFAARALLMELGASNALREMRIGQSGGA